MPIRSIVPKFSWRINDTLLPFNLYSRGQLLIQPSPKSAASNSISSNSLITNSTFSTNYEINGAESRNDAQQQQQLQTKYNNHHHLSKQEEEWLKFKRSDLVSSNNDVNKFRIKRDNVNNLNSNVNSHHHHQIKLNKKQDFKLDNFSKNLKNQSTIYQNHLSTSNERPANWSLINDQQQQQQITKRLKKDKKLSPQQHYPTYHLDASNQLSNLNFDTTTTNLNTNNHHQLDNSFFTSTNHLANVSDLYVSKLNLDTTKLYGFGIVECYAENQIGIQEEPCTYQIIPAGKLFIIIIFMNYSSFSSFELSFNF